MDITVPIIVIIFLIKNKMLVSVCYLFYLLLIEVKNIKNNNKKYYYNTIIKHLISNLIFNNYFIF